MGKQTTKLFTAVCVCVVLVLVLYGCDSMIMLTCSNNSPISMPKDSNVKTVVHWPS